MQQENSSPILYQGKTFTTWEQAFETMLAVVAKEEKAEKEEAVGA